MPLKEAIEVHSPEASAKAPEVMAVHIAKKYGKYHGHIEMHDGSMHKMAPHPTLMEAHQAIGEHLNTYGHEEGKAEPGNMEQAAEMPEREGEVA